MTLDISLRLGMLLQANGFQVIMTRDTDDYISLSGRTSYANANGADRFVSIHINAFNPSTTGLETYCYSEGSAASFDMRDLIQQEIIKAWPLSDRGGKTAGFYVLKNTNMPSTLSEMGFIDNCSIDATYIGNPNERQSAAQAHLIALQRHFGLSVDEEEPDPNSSSTGNAEGLVFEDQGQGRDDTSARLAGARVEVVETGGHTLTEGDGSWSIRLEPGTYTLKASKAGYEDNRVGCDVEAEQGSWCPIGLTKSKLQSQPLDLSIGSDAGTIDGAFDHDGFPAGGDGEPLLGQRPFGSDQGCSCSLAGAAPPTGGVILGLGLALLALVRKRRMVAGLLLAAGMMLAFSALAEQTLSPTIGRSTARLEGIRQVAAGNYQAPVMSPSGKQLVFTGPRLDGLYLVSTDGGRVKRLSERAKAGYLPVWRADSRAIGLRTHGRAFTTQPLSALDLSGAKRESFTPVSGVGVIQHQDCIYLQTRTARVTVACGTDRYYAPQISPDGRYLVYNGLVTGLFLYRLSDGQRIALGSAHQPSFSGDGRRMVFTRTKDDGHQLTAAEIWITDLHHPSYQTFALTRTPDVLEQSPSLSGDGSLLSYSADGRIYVANVIY